MACSDFGEFERGLRLKFDFEALDRCQGGCVAGGPQTDVQMALSMVIVVSASSTRLVLSALCCRKPLICWVCAGDWRSLVDLRTDVEMAIVVSDIENSTMLSVDNPSACAQAQDIHDHIMMELITQCQGLELLREGDSFRVAFKHVHQAVLFCLKVLNFASFACLMRILPSSTCTRLCSLASRCPFSLGFGCNLHVRFACLFVCAFNSPCCL